MKTVNQIRDEFLKYFENEGHEIIPSSPLVPQNDPSLLFVNSGMVQFKNVFTGAEQRPYKRATTSQKCVRAGGKHNDLENVGYTARHHTFFEMLGNFSFGDYFKDDAIAFSWELVTKYFGLPADKLLVTVYSEDDYAASVWKKVAGLSDDRIIRISTSDNFWMMGDTGPCGPCSEIFYDHGPGIPGGPPGSKDEDGDRFIEIWNLVFMQYEQFADGSRENLPNPCIDTGMGLERIAAILQGKHDNYDIDLLRSIIDHVADLTSTNPDGDQSASHRVIADHLRASAFLIADGVLPGNEGRGYVLRRIMRRGMRHANILGAQDPLLYKLVPTLNAQMAEAYPELRRAETLITETLSLEEQKFKKTLEHGLHLLEEETANLSKGDQLAGDVAFKLYDTFGFPLDLTQDALRAKGIGVDLEGFEKCMERQRHEARKAWSGSGDAATEKLWFDILDKHEPTEFLGYETEKAEGRILEIIKDGSRIEKLDEGDEAIILTNQTPFYAESGGQAGDTGIIKTEKGAEFVVKDTQKKLGKLWAHIGKVSNGTINSGENTYLEVDHIRRARIKANHSATHLMHEALRRVLGDHVAQKGSFQNNERTRFDISHNKAVTEEQVREIESIVNKEIRANTKVTTHIMSYNDALETGAQALFGEKYGDEVRVVAMGTKPEDENKRFSVELCGGTHVNRTGEIGLFKLVAQSAVSSGVRRVEALTGENAFAYLERQEETVQQVAGLLKSSSADVLDRLETLVAENRKLSQEVKDLRKKLATGGTGAANGPEITEVSGIKFTGQILVDIPAKDLKSMADDLKAQLGSGVVALITKNEGKASLVVAVTDDLTPRMSAVDLVKAGAEKLGGKGGGGRPDMAQAGGPNADAANDAFLAIQEKLSG